MLLSNVALDLPTQQVLSIDITPEATSKQERLVLLAQKAVAALQGAG